MKKRAADEPILFSGSSHPELGESLAKELGVKPGNVQLQQFSDGESYVNVLEDVADRHVFVLQSGHVPANDNLMELCLMLRAVKDLGPASLSAVMPFMPYRRQERRVEPGEPVSAELAIKMIELSGATHAIAVDLHATTNETFFDIPLDHLHAWTLLSNAAREHVGSLENLTVVAPDEGSRRQASSVAHELGVPLAVMNKKRPGHDKVVITDLAGDVEGRNLLIVDDEVCTAGTITAAAERLKKVGARNVYFAVTHPVLTHPGPERLKHSHLDGIFVSDTIPVPETNLNGKIRVVSVAPMIAEAIRKHMKMAKAFERMPRRFALNA